MTGLRDRIDSGLSARRYSPDEFEIVVNLLLEPIYPGLIPIPGGSDDGRDADIPRGAETPFRLITTTERGVLGNVRKSLDRMVARGLAVPGVVVATNQLASAKLRRQIEQVAIDHGTRLLNVHDRRALVPLLYREPELRLRLLNISGEGDGVLDRPLELDSGVAGRATLVGREDAIAAIAGAAGDVLIVGAPGSGKTRVAAESSTAFLEARLTDAARDAIRRDFPERVVVDDAAERLPDIDALRGFRQAEDLPFRIVAVAWPDDQEAVSEHLPGATIVLLPDMERAQIGDLIKDLGVTGHILTAVILDASRGRPGWAASLAALATDGSVRSVLSGDALLARVKPYVRTLADTEERGLAILAAIAAIDGAGEAEVTRLGAHLRMPNPDVRRVLNRASSSGLLETRWNGVVVSPTLLGEALVAAWYFSSGDRADFVALLEEWPDRQRQLLLSAIKAARLGSDAAAQFALEHLEEVAACGLLVPFAGTTRENAERAVAVARAAGGDVDVYRAGLGARSGQAVYGLLDLAVGDDRDLGRTPAHPARILGEYARALHPDLPHRVDVREWVVDEAITWFTVNQDAASALAIARVLEDALDPWLEGNWLEPVSGTSLQLVAALESAATMSRIREVLWPKVAALLPLFSEAALIRIVELIGTWTRTAAGIAGMHGLKPSKEQAAEARLVAEGMARDLEPLGSPSLPVTLALRRQMERWKWPGLAAIDEDLALIVATPTLERADRERQLTNLGERWAGEAPEGVMTRLVEWRTAASAAGIDTGWALRIAFGGLAEATSRPTDWSRAIVDAGLAFEAVAVLQVSAAKDAEGASTWLDVALESEARVAALQVALNPRSDPDVRALALQRLEERDASLVDYLMVARERPDEVAEALLNHESINVAQRAALGFDVLDTGHGPPLPAAWRDRWDEVFLTIRTTTLSGMAEYELESKVEGLAAERPELVVAWVMGQVDELPADAWSLDLFPFSVTKPLRPLPGQSKAELATKTAGMPFAHELLGLLLTSDTTWVEPLLEAGVLSHDQLLEGIGHVGHDWDDRRDVFEAFAPLLIRRGVPPMAIVTLQGTDGWVGTQADHLRGRLAYFADLATRPDPEFSAIGQAAEAHLRPLIDEVETRERERRIRGRD